MYPWNSNCLGGRGRRIVSSKPALAKLAELYLKKKIIQTEALGNRSMAVYLPNLSKALGLIPITTTKRIYSL
jgi:hypothetical protein